MFKRKLKLNKYKSNIKVVGNPPQITNIDLPSILKLDQFDINFSTALRYLRNIFDKKINSQK